MRKFLLASALIAAPALANAVPFSLTDNWSTGTVTSQTGTLPNLSTAPNQNTSNDGTVSPLPEPKTQGLILNTPTSGEFLFVASPNGSGHNSAIIPIVFTLSDGGGGTKTFTVYMDYYANFYTQVDDMAWSTTLPSSAGYQSSGSITALAETLSDGAVVQISLPYSTDWNMGQAVTFDFVDAPPATVPEPASLALLASGMIGLSFIRRHS